MKSLGMKKVISLSFGLNWQDESACIGDWDLFDEDIETGEYLDVELAKSICAVCPVKPQCAKAGKNEVSGIWGGEVKK